ncbi:permease [Caballeronia mineralivorans]|uniref:permease n=1 Tax=Caballeronia mineralivorans TaxID=2010198 RepID=UPI00069FE35C|nr:permease [Caballeronia mineralivorans]
MIWGTFVGPLIALVSFTCSVGNVPLAAVLWNGGIGFGGVAAFIFDGLIIPPILNIYRKYYGGKMPWYMLVTFYVAMVVAALAAELILGLAGLVPQQRNVGILTETITFNCTTVLDIVFAAISVVLIIVFYRSGGYEHHHEHGRGEASDQGDTAHTHEHARTPQARPSLTTTYSHREPYFHRTIPNTMPVRHHSAAQCRRCCVNMSALRHRPLARKAA